MFKQLQLLVGVLLVLAVIPTRAQDAGENHKPANAAAGQVQATKPAGQNAAKVVNTAAPKPGAPAFDAAPKKSAVEPKKTARDAVANGAAGISPPTSQAPSPQPEAPANQPPSQDTPH